MVDRQTLTAPPAINNQPCTISFSQLIVDRGLRQGSAVFNFEKLETGQKAIGFADMVYEATRNFPADERFGLTNQMRRGGRVMQVASNNSQPSTINSA
jgi:hypothetical protein